MPVLRGWRFLRGDIITSKAGGILLGLFLYIPVVWAALMIAQCWGGSLPALLQKLAAALQSPLDITWTERSAPAVNFL